jgi:superoxide dismutase
MQITLPKLPYPDDALEPHISRTTLQVHHGQHHRVYVENVRTLAKQVRLADRPLEHILRQTAGQDGHRALSRSAKTYTAHCSRVTAALAASFLHDQDPIRRSASLTVDRGSMSHDAACEGSVN